MATLEVLSDLTVTSSSFFLLMKSSVRHPNKYVGLPVFKMAVDRNGREKYVAGKVINYCPGPACYMLLYSDKTSEVVPVDEIDDFMPLLHQLSLTQRSSRKRKARNHSEERARRQPPAKRCKKATQTVDQETANDSPFDAKFVQDTLWALTTVIDVDADKRSTLLATLDNRMEQPRAALAKFIEEDGLDAMNRTLRNWACMTEEGKDKRGKLGFTTCSSSEKSSSRATKIPSTRKDSPCSRHLHDLLLGKCESVFSPKCTKELHASRNKKAFRSNGALHAVSPPQKVPVCIDLTREESSGDEAGENLETSCTPRRLRFGVMLSVLFSKHESVDVFRSQLRQIGIPKREIKQNPELWKSVLKKS